MMAIKDPCSILGPAILNISLPIKLELRAENKLYSNDGVTEIAKHKLATSTGRCY